jgi:hypothetical protein
MTNMPSFNETEVALVGGNENTVVRVGETVRRPVHPWTPAVHVLLRKLEGTGFRESPRAFGFDEQGREILTFIPGEVGNYPLTPAMASDSALVNAARLLRRYHEAATIESGWEDLPWRFRHSDRSRWEVVCHSDFAPYNLVFDAAKPVGIIDFDVAGPGPRLWDIAYAVYRFVPLASDANCLAFGFGEEPDRERRLALFLGAYGPGDLAGLLEMVIERVEGLRDDILRRAAAGDPGVATHLEEDHVGSYNADLAWICEHMTAIDAVVSGVIRQP